MITTHTDSHDFTLGTIVRNLGLTATIVKIHPITGDPILQDAHGCKWLADAAKCERVETACRHKDGLVVFG